MHVGVRCAATALGLPAFYRQQGALYQSGLGSQSLNGGLVKSLGKCVNLLLRRHDLIITSTA